MLSKLIQAQIEREVDEAFQRLMGRERRAKASPRRPRAASVARTAPKAPTATSKSERSIFDGPRVFAKSCECKHEKDEPAPAVPTQPPPVLRGEKLLALHLGQDDAGAAVDWRGDEQTNAFMLITGGSGSGKSELLRSIAGQVSGSIPIVIFDVHGDLSLPGFRSHELGKSLGINPLNQPAPDITQRVREFVSTMRIAVPGLGSRQQLLLSETAREVCRSQRCDLHELRKRLTELQSAKSTADRSSLFGLLASLDSVFGEPVFDASKMLDPRELLRGAHRIDLTQLVRPAQVMVIETILRWLFEAIKAAGPVATRGQLRVFGICDEAALLHGSEVLDLLFREARKFGLGMALASQLANDFGPALRANAGTIFTLRANSAQEVQRNAKELGINPNLVAKLSRPGQAIVRDVSGIRGVQIERWPFRRAAAVPVQQTEAQPKPSKSKRKAAETFDPDELAIGRQIELEHTKSPKVAERIAKDHLREIPDYYTRLRKMEADARQGTAP